MDTGLALPTTGVPVSDGRNMMDWLNIRKDDSRCNLKTYRHQLRQQVRCKKKIQL